jgi:lipopolysaccharide/colanic/teichoic acid biosynthesis glycosyltransferase
MLSSIQNTVARNIYNSFKKLLDFLVLKAIIFIFKIWLVKITLAPLKIDPKTYYFFQNPVGTLNSKSGC